MRIPNEGALKYSILVTVHNNLKPLQKCLESLRNQTYRNYEIIIVDDSSDVEVKNYLQLMEQIDSRIKLSRNIYRNGKGQCKNLLVKQSTGDYIIIVEPTDYVETDLLKKINKSLINDQVDVLHFNNVVEGATPEQIIKEYNKDPHRFNEEKTDVITGEEALSRWVCGKDYTTTTPWSYCIKESLYDRVEFPNSNYFEDIPVIPTILAKARTAKGIDYVGYHMIQYDKPNSDASETDKCLLLSRKLNILKEMIEQAKTNLGKAPISEETKEKVIQDLEKKYETRKQKLEAIINKNKITYNTK